MPVPKYPLSWVINGLSVSRDLGLGIMTRPVRVSKSLHFCFCLQNKVNCKQVILEMFDRLFEDFYGDSLAVNVSYLSYSCYLFLFEQM